MICFKYENIEKNRTRQWRRYILEKKVTYSLKNNPVIFNFTFKEICDITYGKLIWTDILRNNVGRAIKKTYLYSDTSRWKYETKYSRTKYKKQTLRLLYEEGIL